MSPSSADAVVVCEYCDAVTRRVPLRSGERAVCPCCGSPLYRRRQLDVNATLAVVVTALVALVIANAYPVMTMNLQGHFGTASLWQAVMAVNGDGFTAVAVAVAVAGLVAPVVQLVLLLYVCGLLRLGRQPPAAATVLRTLHYVRPWSMVEVLLLGSLVATVKLAGMASVSAGVGLFGFAALTACMAVLLASDPHRLWDWALPWPR
ncbi:MAG TPA: paraquat-inducible protein A [Nevskiaceae bacterium]|nr:paraquat-inducible protein A [Nevskiaceae bacterium]